jgi:hypothetical protein
LKYEADVVPPVPVELALGQGIEFDAVDPQLPAGWPVDPTNEIEQRGLAAAARPEDNGKGGRRDSKRHVQQGMDVF